ncbi:MAG: hypothetical protein AAF639_45715 [Chloroflexota bacterium]
MTGKYNFKQCSIILLEELLNIREVRDMPVLAHWLEHKADIADHERQQLLILQEKLIKNLRNWNETELAYGFIAPLIDFIDYSSENRRFFAKRLLGSKIGNIELSGKPDGIIASGIRRPMQPYFCLHEYKKEDDSDGDPAGQALAAMLVAQEVNHHEYPVYGCYVRGGIWTFMALQGQEYSISHSYVATRDDIFDIFRILKSLKVIIEQMIKVT